MKALATMAEKINQEHKLAEQCVRDAVQHALKAGELLIQAKKDVAHGQWLPWLKKNCEMSERTSQAYMQLATEVPKLDSTKAQRVADLPLREALKLLSSSGEINELLKAKKLEKEANHLSEKIAVYEGYLDFLDQHPDPDYRLRGYAMVAKQTDLQFEAATIRANAFRGVGRCINHIRRKLIDLGVCEKEADYLARHPDKLLKILPRGLAA